MRALMYYRIARIRIQMVRRCGFELRFWIACCEPSGRLTLRVFSSDPSIYSGIDCLSLVGLLSLIDLGDDLSRG